MSNGRIIIIDSGSPSHRAIFESGRMKILKREGKLASDVLIMPAHYTYLNIILSMLKRIVVRETDQIIVACDARKSWRKAFYPLYKGNRNALRDSHDEINWTEEYQKIDEVNQKLNDATNWYFIKISDFISYKDILDTNIAKDLQIFSFDGNFNTQYGIEADDIIATVCKYNTDKEIVIVTGDGDLEMLCNYPNVKYFSTNLKYKKQKGCWKLVENPIKILAKKVKNGDVSDNIIVDKENDTELDVKIRRIIIDLFNLPSFVEEPIKEILEILPNKKINYDLMPLPNSLGKPEKFNRIYSDKNQITWEMAMEEHVKRIEAKKEKNKLVYAKNKAKKQLEKEKAFR